MQTYSLTHGSKYEVDVLGASDDATYPIRVRARCVSPFKTDWYEFNTEPEWFRKRGISPPSEIRS